MTLSIKPAPDGLSATFQIGGVDKLILGPTGIQSGVSLTTHVDDVAAAAAGIPIGGLYHSSGTVKVRLT